MTIKKKRWVTVLQALFGFGLVGVLGLVFWFLQPKQEVPDGWMNLRPPKDVMALLEVGETIWSGGRDGVYVIERSSGVVLEELEADLPLRYVTAVVGDGKRIWVGHAAGLSRYQDGTWQTLTTQDGLPDDAVLDLWISPQTGLWVGTENGLANLDQGEWTIYSTDDGLASNTVSVLYEDSSGRLWAGNSIDPSGGLSCLVDGHWVIYSTGDGLAHQVVNAILEETDGTLWIATGFSSRGGLSRFDDEQWTTISKDDGLAGEKVRSVFLDLAGVLWVGSEYDGIAFSTGPSWAVLTPKEGLSGWEVKAMVQDIEGTLWLGTENGLTRIDQHTWRSLIEGQTSD
jgi:ligand-binding sensor domain-containing protein